MGRMVFPFRMHVPDEYYYHDDVNHMLTNLEAPGVCQHAARPVDELVEAPHVRDQFGARALLQVIGVHQDDMAIQVQQLLACQALHSPFPTGTICQDLDLLQLGQCGWG